MADKISIKQIVQKIKSGDIDILELVQSHLELANTKGANLNAFISVLDEYAIQQVKELIDLQKNNPEKVSKMKLFGIPFTVKDLFNVENTKTTFGSKYMEDFTSSYTATVVEKCMQEGAILIGKTNCDPFGFGASGENSGFGPALHPLNTKLSPGGSSSGSAASLAAGIGIFSIGTDTGGSVRQPAGMCGLFGYKPTYGRNSRFGIGSMASSFDTPGFFTTTSTDLQYLEEIMQGRDSKDATTWSTSAPSSFKPKEYNRQKLKIGIPKEYFSDALDPEIKKSVMQKVGELEQMGYEIIEISIPNSDVALSVYYTLVPAEISSNRAKFDGVRFGPLVDENYGTNMMGGRGSFFEDEVKRRIMIGTYVLSAGFAQEYYKQASLVRTKLKNDFVEIFSTVDIIVSPTSPTTAFELGSKSSNPLEMYLADIFTVTANIVGIPAISIPIDKDHNGLPIGMQIMSAWDSDTILFELAEALEK